MKIKGFYTLQTKSMSDFGAISQKDLWEKVKAEGYKGLAETVKTVFTKDGEVNSYHATFSSSNMDRHGDIVMQVFDLKGFMNNPVYLDSHNYDSIEHIIGKINRITTEGGALNGDVEFNLDNPKGVLASKMVDKGFLNTSSIGFIPKVFDNEGNILESELLEISAVSVPANADALFEKKDIGDRNPDTDETVETIEVPEEIKEPVAETPVVEPKIEEEAPVVEPDIQEENKEEVKVDETPAEPVVETPVEEKIEEKPEEVKEPVVETPVEEAPAPVEEVAEEPKVEVTPEEIASAITEEAEEKKQLFNSITEYLKEVIFENRTERTRKIYQALRELSQK